MLGEILLEVASISHIRLVLSDACHYEFPALKVVTYHAVTTNETYLL